MTAWFEQYAPGNFTLGSYYTGLTRDDIGGLRYLWTTNRIQREAVETNSQLVTFTTPTNIVSSNLAQLLTAELTESSAQFASNFPGLTIVSSTPVGTSNIITTNITNVTVVVTNPPPIYSPPGTPGTVVTNTNTIITYTTNLQTVYTNVFGNLITPLIYLNGGVLVTNFAEYIVTPSNACGFQILSNSGPAYVTNTNTGVIFLTNHLLAVEIPSCGAPPVMLREGMGRMTFVRVDYDSFIGQSSWGPVSNTYTLTAVTNSRPVVQTFSRNVTAPDIVFSAGPFAPGPGTYPMGYSVLSRTQPNYNTNNMLPNGAGPGTITPGGANFIFSDDGPVFETSGGSFVDSPIGDGTLESIHQYGSFDGTTNLPVAYPTSTTLQSLQNNIFLQITLTGPLPNGNVGISYAFQLPATGAAGPPYTWSVVARTGGLPPGLDPHPRQRVRLNFRHPDGGRGV